MADKLTQQITDALSRAAADPAGLPLYAGKTDPGLFPAGAGAKLAAQRCLADGLVRLTGTDTRGKAPRELYALTEKGWEFLLAAVNPKQILEDFVRLLEARQGEVGELLSVARRMADSLQGLKDAVARVLPQVSTARVPANLHEESDPNPQAPFPAREEGEMAARLLPSPHRGGAGGGVLSVNGQLNGTAVLELPATSTADLGEAILARLAEWTTSANVGQDCPLPELYRSLTTRDPAPTIGEFHDSLRQLRAAGVIHLHPWTGPLYAMPETAYALLDGHNVAYYASARSQDSGFRSRGSGQNSGSDHPRFS